MGMRIASAEPMHPLDPVVFVVGIGLPIAIKMNSSDRDLLQSFYSRLVCTSWILASGYKIIAINLLSTSF